MDVSGVLVGAVPQFSVYESSGLVLLGAGLVGMGIAQAGNRNKNLGLFLGAAGAIAAIAGISSQWFAWFPTEKMAAQGAMALYGYCSPGQKFDLQAECINDFMPKMYLECGISKSQLKMGEHFNLQAEQSVDEETQCQFEPTPSFVERCQKLAMNDCASDPKMEFKKICMKNYAKEQNIDFKDLAESDFQNIEIIPINAPDHYECHMFPSDSLHALIEARNRISPGSLIRKSAPSQAGKQ